MHYIDRKYLLLLSSRLERFKEVRENLFNFRCPICGDSDKKKNKARGYVYSDSMGTKFKCHNCGASMMFSSFIKTIDSNLFKNYKIERFKSSSFVSSTQPKILKQQNKSNVLEYLVPIDQTPPDNETRQYVESRKIPEKFWPHLFHTDNLNEISSRLDNYKALKLPSVPALVIPFFTWNGNYDFILCRTLSSKKQFRFITFEVNSPGLKLWGIPWVDWNKDLFIFEGPIDAMFVDNGVAVSGSNHISTLAWLLKKKKKHELCFCFDNDYYKNKEIKKVVNKRIEEGFQVLLYDKQFKWKDINDAVRVGGWNKKQIASYIDERSFIDLRARLEMVRK